MLRAVLLSVIRFVTVLVSSCYVHLCVGCGFDDYDQDSDKDNEKKADNTSCDYE